MRLNLLLFVVLALRSFGVSAQYAVNNTTDGDATTSQLRGAIEAADLGGTSTITVAAGTYTLTLGSITFGSVPETITITGAGAGQTIIKMAPGSAADRIFNINQSLNSNVNITISGVTFEGGALSSDAIGGGAIQAGGPSNSTVLQDCSFINDSTQNSNATVGVSNGGAVAMEGGGVFTVTNCTFMNCSDHKGSGGAIYYFLQSSEAGSLTITGSTFSGDTVSSNGSEGGAIYIATQGGTASSAVSITGNTFIGNLSKAGAGGAIQVLNNTPSTFFINYNRFYGNRAQVEFPDVAVGGGSGNVDITNNWWAKNVAPTGVPDPHAGLTGASTGTLTSAPYLELTCSAGASSICTGAGGNATVMTAGFTRNSAGTGISTALLGAFVGVPVGFSSSSGTLTGAQGTIQSNGTATVTFTDNGVTGTDNVQPVADSVGSADVVADGVVTVIAPASLASGSSSTTFTMGSGTTIVTSANCGEIASLVASGASPVSGSVTAAVTLDASVQRYQGVPYVTRHYDITPASNASSATATVTLYFLQSEFNAYNAVVNNAAMSLPTSSSDAAGAARLTITQYHGSGTLPGNYSGGTGPGPASVLISPGSSNVVWNSAKNWWEVSFPVAGFSGFYVAGPVGLPLPVTLERFTGMLQGTGVLLNWQVADETGFLRYEVEGSADGVGFSPLGAVAAASSPTAAPSGTAGASGAAGAGPGWAGAYQYFVADPAMGENYYRLKMVNADGTFTYSPIVVVDVSSGGRGVVVLSNPFVSSCTLRVTVGSGGPVSMRLMDMSGKVLSTSVLTLVAGVNTFVLPGTSGLAAGVYLVSLVGSQVRATVKVVKE